MLKVDLEYALELSRPADLSTRARDLLRRAVRGFGDHEELARARCVVAEAEVALARAHAAADRARVPALVAEVAEARATLNRSAA